MQKSWEGLGQVLGAFLCDCLGEPGGNNANCLGDIGNFLGEFFERFAKSLGDLCHLLAAFLGDCFAKS